MHQMSRQLSFGLKGSWKPVARRATMCTESVGTFDHSTVHGWGDVNIVE